MLQTLTDDDQCSHTAILKWATLLLSAAKPSEIEKKEHCISESGDGKSARERGCEGKREIYVEFGPVRKREALKCIIKTGVLRFSVLADNSVLWGIKSWISTPK